MDEKNSRTEIEEAINAGDCLIVIHNGEAKVRKLPDYGKYEVVMHDGAVKWVNNYISLISPTR